MKNTLKYIILLILAVSATSCVITNRTTRLLQERAGIAQYDSVPYPSYRLHVNDELQMRVISLNKDISATFNMGGQQTGNSYSGVNYRVYPDGTIDVPFADSIPVVGLTLEEAEKVLQERLKDVGNEDMTVRLNLSNNYFYMVGANGKGRFNIYKDRMTMYQAIAEAGFVPGGVGNLKKIQIIRQNENNEPQIVSFDIRSKSLINSEYYYVQPNDIIYVEKTKGSYFKVDSYTALTGFITSSISFLLLMLTYVN
ncbi:MAG: polysaccharide biosynthesis/export family protein [Prevotellaceae bacterium]|nr:polysaccharide biosynthesis/export family protein [Prevotellaceae bacterium]